MVSQRYISPKFTYTKRCVNTGNTLGALVSLGAMSSFRAYQIPGFSGTVKNLLFGGSGDCTHMPLVPLRDSRGAHEHTHTTPLTILSSSTGGLRSPLRPSTLSAASYLPTTAVRTSPCPRAGFIPPRLPGLSAPAHTDLPSPQTRNIKYFPALPFSIFRLATARCCG